MQQLDAWKSLPQEVRLFPEFRKKVKVPRTAHSSEVDASPTVTAHELLRSRTRARRRRRKRAWGAPWAYLLSVFLVYGTLLACGRR